MVSVPIFFRLESITSLVLGPDHGVLESDFISKPHEDSQQI